MRRRRVFLVTESDEYLIGTEEDVLSEDGTSGAHTANSVIRGLVEEMVFGDFEYTDERRQVTIEIR